MESKIYHDTNVSLFNSMILINDEIDKFKIQLGKDYPLTPFCVEVSRNIISSEYNYDKLAWECIVEFEYYMSNLEVKTDTIYQQIICGKNTDTPNSYLEAISLIEQHLPSSSYKILKRESPRFIHLSEGKWACLIKVLYNKL